jgi:hypothetical protein
MGRKEKKIKEGIRIRKESNDCGGFFEELK